MFFQFGRKPALTIIRYRGSCSQVCHGLAALLLCSFTAHAQSAGPLTLAEAEALALADEPGQLALEARAASFEARAVVAQRLPDPMLRVGLNNYPISSGGFSTEGMTNAAVGLHQVFPGGDSRGISARRFNLLAGEMNANALARQRNVLASARIAWLDALYWNQAHELVTESRPFFEDLDAVTRSLYAVGRKSQQDLLRADLELSRLEDRLIEVERQRARAHAVLGEWVGQDAERPVAGEIPSWDEILPLEILRASLLEHPALRASDEQIAAREAGVDLAKERSKPDWSVDIGYSYRDGTLPSGAPRSDFVSLNVTVGLPFLNKESVDNDLLAALQERSAAQAGKQQALRQMQSQLDAEYAHWRELTRRLALYESRILDQARANADAALLAYQSDQGDFANVMRAYIDNLNTRLEHVRLQVERAQSYAVLANLGGISE